MWHLVEVFIPIVLWVMLRPNPDMINSFLFFPPFLSFFYIVTETHPSHLKATVSPLSQLISLSPSVCPSAFPLPRIRASILLPPSPFSQAEPPLWYSQSHLQSDIFNGLITLSSHSLIEHLTSTPHLPRPRCSLLTSTHLQASNAFFSPAFYLSSMLPLLPPFHLISSKALPSTADPTPTSCSLKWPRRPSPSSRG